MTKRTTALPARNVGAYLAQYPAEVFGEDSPEEVFDRYHTADFVMINDGVTFDRQRMIDHVAPARKRATGAEVEVHEVVMAQDRAAARYTLTAHMRTGTTITTEIYMFGQFAEDGRLRRIEQITRDLG